MKIMFMGTPEFANYSLMAMKDEGYDVCAVVTQPDKPKGRGHNMAHPAVYDMAESYNIPIYQPVNLKKETFEDILVSVNPDIIVVTAYGKILPEYVLSYPKYGCINVHGSLLPKYRGAAPMQWAIINGETKTGITIMYMEKGLDTGDMILKEEIDITCEDTYETLHDKMAELSKGALISALKLIEEGNEYDEVICIGPIVMMKFVSMLTKEFGVKTIVSMNPVMVDGTGMCGGCRLTVGGEVKFACVDGPEFDGHLVDFDEAIKRSGTYKDFEKGEREKTCNLYKKEVE